MDRRERYLNAALQRFSQHGFAGTTMDMIVADVGGSKATLYKYFPAKDTLIAGLMDQVAQSVVNVGAVLDDAQPLEQALEQFAHLLLRWVSSERAVTLLRVCLGEYGRFPDLSRVVWTHGPVVTYGRFREFLAARTARGELKVEDTQLAAEHFMAGLVGHVQIKIAMGQAGQLDDAEIARRVRAITELFLARYRVRRTVAE